MSLAFLSSASAETYTCSLGVKRDLKNLLPTTLTIEHLEEDGTVLISDNVLAKETSAVVRGEVQQNTSSKLAAKWEHKAGKPGRSARGVGSDRGLTRFRATIRKSDLSIKLVSKWNTLEPSIQTGKCRRT